MNKGITATTLYCKIVGRQVVKGTLAHVVLVTVFLVVVQMFIERNENSCTNNQTDMQSNVICNMRVQMYLSGLFRL